MCNSLVTKTLKTNISIFFFHLIQKQFPKKQIPHDIQQKQHQAQQQLHIEYQLTYQLTKQQNHQPSNNHTSDLKLHEKIA